MLKISGFFSVNFEVFKSSFTFSIFTKEIVCIIGESGSGKSTFLKCLSGLIIPSNGYLNINNNIFYDSKKNLFIKPYLRKIGYVFQNPYLYPYMNVLENVTFAFRKDVFSFSVNSLMSYLNLNKIKYKSINNLSGGEKQRVSLAQVLLSGSNIILLDEVLSNQDNNMKVKLMSLFKFLNENDSMSFIYVSHDIKSLTSFSNFIMYFSRGRLCVSS